MILGSPSTSLAPLRRAMEAKARGQASAVYLMLGGASFAASFLLTVDIGPIFVFIAAAVLVALGLGFLALLEKYVVQALRRLLLGWLRENSFPFEENLSMTREIGDLFGVESGPEDTLDTYLERLRTALGLEQEAPRQVHRRITGFQT